MSREFTAKWAFTCGCCGTQQPEGVLAQFGPDGILRCVEPDHTPVEGDERYTQPSGEPSRDIEVMPRGKTAQDRCDRCFIIHANGQEECY